VQRQKDSDALVEDTQEIFVVLSVAEFFKEDGKGGSQAICRKVYAKKNIEEAP
jgi:hypothetical protein